MQQDGRGVRDRYTKKLEKNFKRKMAEEQRASGISPEQTELDKVIEDIVEMSESAQEELQRGDENKRLNVEREKKTAEIVRKRSMDRLPQTREREGSESAKKRKRTGGETETVVYFKGKHEKDREL